MNKGLYVIVMSALLAGTANASDFTGPIGPDGLRFSTGASSPARVSVSVPNMTTACPVSSFYAYENAASGLAGLWTAALTQARIHGRPIKIVGTGVCDSSGIEGISFLDLK
jgi:hypothetical protein